MSYTATIGSPGSCPSGVTFVTLPSGVTLNSYDTSTCAATFNGLPTDLASGQSFNFGFSYTAPGTGVVPVNTTINATGDANPANNTASGFTTVLQAPKLGLAKTDGTTTVNAGGTTNYTLTVSNTGNIATSGTITVVDVLPSGMTIADGAVTLSGAQSGNWSCTAASNVITCTSSTAIAAGGTSVFGYTVNVSASATGTLTNKAEVGGGGDPLTSPPTSTSAGNCSAAATPTPGCAIDSDTAQAPKLGLAKSDGTTTVNAGGTTAYTLTVSNTGNIATSGTITVVDVLPSGMTIANGAVPLSGAQSGNWSCTAASNVMTCTSSTAIAAGGTSVFGYTVNVSASATGTLTNKAEVGGGGDPLTSPPTSASAGNCSAAATPTPGCAIDSDTAQAPKLGLAKSDGTTTVNAGGTTAYTLTVSNTGNVATSGTITVVDVLPGGMTIANGAVPLSGAQSGNWSCTAASNVLTCTSSTAIAAGGTSMFGFTVNVSASATGTLTNKAEVGGGGDPLTSPPTPTSAGNCSAAATPTPGCAIDSDTAQAPKLGLAKSDGTTTVNAGGTTAYTLTVSNTGNVATSGTITVVDVLPGGMTIANGAVPLSGAQSGNWSCTAASNVLTCTSSTAIAAGGTSMFGFTVNVSASATGTLTNKAEVGGGGDPLTSPPTPTSAGNCSAAATPTPGCAIDSDTAQAPKLGLAKSDGTTTVNAGGTTAYTLTVSNTGNVATSGTITVVDVLPGGMTIANGAVPLSGAQSGNWSCTAASNVMTCTSSTAIAAGGTSVFGYTVNVSASATGTLTNKAEVGGGGDPLTSPPTSTSAGNCSAAATPTPGCAIDSDTAQAPKLGLAKSDGTTTVNAGGTTDYTLTVSNTGNIATSGTITVVDVLPGGMTIADGAVPLSGAQSGNWSCTAASNVMTCTSSTAIAAGGTSVFGYTVNVSASATGTLTNKAEVGGGGDPLTSPPTSTSAGNCSAAATPTPGCAIDSDTVNPTWCSPTWCSPRARRRR